MAGYARNFTDLYVYQKSRTLADSVFTVTKGFPKEEKYALTDQVRRASRAIGAQIAEAWGKRRYEKHFIAKLSDADSEQLETQHWIQVAADSGYLAPERSAQLIAQLAQIGRMLDSMMVKAHRFCGPRESQ